MPVPNIASIGDNPSTKDLENYIIKLQRDLEWLLQNLDDMNVNRLTAKSIFVDELSAISANLGHIMAGIIEGIEIYGSFIATSKDSFPRAEMSSSNQMFRVMLSPTSYAEFAARVGLGAGETPALRFMEGTEEFVLGHGAVLGGYMGMNINDYFMISADDGVYINKLELTSWTDIKSAFAGKTLQQELSALNNSINSINNSLQDITTTLNNKATKGTSTGSAGSANGGIAPGTRLMVEGGGYVTWNGIPSHSHTQN